MTPVIRARATATRGLLRRALWALARLRAGRTVTAVDLSRQFEISLRTAYRDFDFLRDDWRVPVAFDRARRTFRLTEPAALVAPVTLSRGEVVAVFFAERVLRQYRGTPFEEDLASAFRKIQELLPEEVSVSPDTIDACLSLDIGPVHTPDAHVFAGVLAALRLRRAALVRYRSLNSGRTTDRRIHPYHVFNHRGDWYVAAWDDRRRAVRDFALHRIRRMTTTTERYEILPSFDAKAYLGQAFAIEKGGKPVEVAIRFVPRQARWIRERRWHATARVQGTIDGGCVLRLRVSGLDEVRRWVMQFGSEAEVLAPVTLRREVAAELAAAAEAYRHTATELPPRRTGPSRSRASGGRASADS
jgi:predicted DNA-binding transcriptional regulator YafY